MSSAMIGGLVGLGIGIGDFVVFGKLIDKMRRDPARRGAIRALEMVRSIQLLALPVAGYFIGAYAFDSVGSAGS